MRKLAIRYKSNSTIYKIVRTFPKEWTLNKCVSMWESGMYGSGYENEIIVCDVEEQ